MGFSSIRLRLFLACRVRGISVTRDLSVCFKTCAQSSRLSWFRPFRKSTIRRWEGRPFSLFLCLWPHLLRHCRTDPTRIHAALWGRPNFLGTTTGAILAALLALGPSVDDIHTLYKEHGLTIVRRRSCPGKSTTLSHLAVTVFGNCKFSAPVVLLLHGSRSSSHMFRNLIPLLADKNQRGRRTTVRAIRLSLRDFSAQKALFAI
jgi:hypothetical protein